MKEGLAISRRRHRRAGQSSCSRSVGFGVHQSAFSKQRATPAWMRSIDKASSSFSEPCQTADAYSIVGRTYDLNSRMVTARGSWCDMWRRNTCPPSQKECLIWTWRTGSQCVLKAPSHRHKDVFLLLKVSRKRAIFRATGKRPCVCAVLCTYQATFLLRVGWWCERENEMFWVRPWETENIVKFQFKAFHKSRKIQV